MRLFNHLMGALIAAAVVTFAAGAASAQTVGNSVNGGPATIDAVFDQIGQVVDAPNTQLDEFTLEIARNTTATLTVVPRVYTSSGGVVSAVPVWSGAPVAVTSTTPAAFTFHPNLTVTPGQKYVLAVQLQSLTEDAFVSAAIAGNYVPDDLVIKSTGGTWASFAGQDLFFSATFSATPPPSAVPTLSEWAMILMGLVLAGAAAVFIQRRRLTA